MSRPEIYSENAAAMWTSIDQATEPIPGAVRIETARTTRVLLLHPQPATVCAELVAAEPTNKRLVVEDPFGALPSTVPDGVMVKRQPVMIRPVEPLQPLAKPGITVVRVTGPHELALADQIIIGGFPVEGALPGQILSTRVLDLPQWHVWLAYHHGEPAAAGYTYDDGVAAGVYLLATLPQHRSAGIGRALMTVAVGAHAQRLGALVATEAGAPLYKSMGFVPVSTSTWYVRSTAD